MSAEWPSADAVNEAFGTSALSPWRARSALTRHTTAASTCARLPCFGVRFAPGQPSAEAAAGDGRAAPAVANTAKQPARASSGLGRAPATRPASAHVRGYLSGGRGVGRSLHRAAARGPRAKNVLAFVVLGRVCGAHVDVGHVGSIHRSSRRPSRRRSETGTAKPTPAVGPVGPRRLRGGRRSGASCSLRGECAGRSILQVVPLRRHAAGVGGFCAARSNRSDGYAAMRSRSRPRRARTLCGLAFDSG
jgi:hypothetical protein